MSRMAEAYQEQQEQDNLSGSDIFDAQQWEETMNQIPVWAKENRRILNELEALQDAIRGKQESKNV